jgi:Tfp pilus assembly protein PilF
VRPRSRPSSAGAARDSTGRRTRAALLVSIALIALVAGIYAPVRTFGFVPLDDLPYVPENPHVATGLSTANVLWAFTSRWASYWIPLTWISYMVEVQVAGVNPHVHHVTNVVLHGANVLLLFWWLRRETASLWRSAGVAALFVAHPLHVESVAWITERKDVLSTCFLLLALFAYSSCVRRHGVGRMAVVGLCFAAGIMAKPMVLTLPLLLLLADVWPLGRASFDAGSGPRWRDLVIEKWPLFVVAIAAAAVTYATQDLGGATKVQDVLPVALRLANVPVSYVIYLRQAVWPVDLAVLYPYPESISTWRVAIAIAVLAAISVVVYRRRSSHPHAAVGWLWFLVALVPVIGLVQAGLQPHADRFTYVPLIGIYVALLWSLPAAVSRPWRVASGAAVVAAVAMCSVVASQQVRVWQDGRTLWSHAVAVTPASGAYQAHFELGSFELSQARTSEAITNFEAAIRARPSFAGAHAALGVAFEREGRLAEAAGAYDGALRSDPAMPEIQNNLGALLARDGHVAEALPHFEAAVRLKPDLESAQVNLGVALVRIGRPGEAVPHLRAALAINPANAQAQRVLDLIGRPPR